MPVPPRRLAARRHGCLRSLARWGLAVGLAVTSPVASPVAAQEGRGVIYLADRQHGTVAYTAQHRPLGPVQDPTAAPLPMVVSRNAVPVLAPAAPAPRSLGRAVVPRAAPRALPAPVPRLSTQGRPPAAAPSPRSPGGQALQVEGATGGGQWRVTAQGCTYSRAQAPGRAPTWHLVLNPRHVGQPPSARRCLPMLR
ncbi:hypothetical protein [Pseudooceanicola nanhaiensis]|uniref:hypothetical protein n=1 Tax=Pseudooceanicola nanhaiensis TaxID=375761 RepID=UPI001CD58CB3|nr:hypothetical protein [Pseudooceanicola nanhaiensis]MCA0921331.1 hypothetical protein [Pseudooceanicola nanhaiensis]